MTGNPYTLHFIICAVIVVMPVHGDQPPTPSKDAVPLIPAAEKQPELAPQFEQVTAKSAGWSTEVFSDKTYKQLKRLSKRIDRAVSDGNKLPEFTSNEFHSTSLRPSERLKSVFADECFEVLQFRQDKKGTPAKLTLDAAVAGLREPFDPTKEVRVTFKVIGVDLGSDSPATTVLVQTFGSRRGGSGSMQQTARWRCHWSDADNDIPLLARIELLDFEDVVSKSKNSKAFEDCTEAVVGASSAYKEQLVFGVDHWRRRLDRSLGISVTDHHGLAVGDVNSDGLDDLYVCQPGGLPNRLLIQNPDGTVSDKAADFGVDFLESTFGALMLDLDNDGDQDLALSMDWGVFFVRNNGDGTFILVDHHFIDAENPKNISKPGSLSAADFDNDGDLDLYVCHYSLAGMYTEENMSPLPYHDANNGSRNMLLRNEGAFRFADVTDAVGLDKNNRRFSFAASWADYDNDGDQDLYVANDFGRNNLYENRDGQFVDVAAQAGVEDIAAGMPVSWGDYNNDGWLDLYVSNMFSSAGNRIAYQRKFKSDSADSTRSLYQRHARGNTLFVNNGNRTFSDISVEAGVTMGRWAWSSMFFDMNCDGLLDILVANGYITQEDTGDL